MFLDKLKPYLHFGNKNRIKRKYLSPHNEYCGRIADRLGTAEMLLLALLTIFLLVSLIFNNEWVSYDNLHYFITDFGSYLTSADDGIDRVILDADENSGIGVFGGKLAVAGKTGLRLYTPSGRVAISDDTVYSRAAIETSDRYMLVYGTGGKSFSVYNLFTEVYSESTEYPIYGAAVADNGSFAIITGDNTHVSAVKVYNRRFEEIMNLGRASYVVDVAISDSGDRLGVLSFAESGGVIKTRLYLSRVPSSEAYAEIEIDGTVPLYCTFTSSGNAVAVCTDRIVTYDKNGNRIEEIPTANAATQSVLTDVAVGDFGCVAVLSGYEGSEVIVIDKRGRAVYNQTVDDVIISVEGCGDHVFLDTDKEIIRLEYGSGTETRASKSSVGTGRIAVRNDGEVFYFLPSGVEYIKF